MSTSKKIHELAIRYFEKFDELNEKRRQIDFDMSKGLKLLENNNQTVDGRILVEDYKEKIADEENLYLNLHRELKEIYDEFKPLLVKVNAHRNNRLETQIPDNSHIDSFIDEEGNIICMGPFTRI